MKATELKITAIRSDEIYERMMNENDIVKENLYRDELMKPFEGKWNCIGIPLKAEVEGGYDVISMMTMGGSYHPRQITSDISNQIELIKDDTFWQSCEDSIRNTLEGFMQNGIDLPVKEYIFSVLLQDSEHPMSKMTGDYCGDGGIPGFIIGTIIPNETSLRMLPVALAHEANHNVRWQFMKWSNSITLADMLVSEGLAENFAAAMFGEEKIGIWVKNTSEEMLREVIKPEIRKHLEEQDFNVVASYLYGDEIMSMRGAIPVGMPYCAGYACGYAMIKHYLKKTGKSIYEATILPTSEIMKELEDFWE